MWSLLADQFANMKETDLEHILSLSMVKFITSFLAVGKHHNNHSPESIDKMKSQTIPIIIETVLAKEDASYTAIKRTLDLWKFYEGLSDRWKKELIEKRNKAS